MSMAEAEYRAMTEITQRSIYAKAQAVSFISQIESILLDNDNKPAIAMFIALRATKRSKFTDLRHHYL